MILCLSVSGICVKSINISFRLKFRSISSLQNDPGSLRTSLGAMQTVANSEYGALYVSADGEFVYQDRGVTAGSIGGTVTTFNDNGTEFGK